MPPLLTLLSPWEFSPTVLLCTVGAAALFWRGLVVRRRTGHRTGVWRSLSFFLGLALIYVALQSYVDYISQHMFWVHRLQHLVLHHVGPFLIVLAVPHEVMGAALPTRLRERVLVPLWRSPPVRWPYRILQNPVVASALFVGLIYFWLRSDVHFDAMLSARLYKLMNWSMVIDGLLFWWLMVDPRPPLEHRTPRYPVRILMLWAIMLPQIAIGAYITLSDHILYSVYSVCGRAWPISPMVDQEVGGVITWIPAAMMSVVAILVVLRLWMHDSARRNAPSMPAAPPAPAMD